MGRRLSNLFLILILMAGLFLLLYPSVSNWWNSMHQTQAIDIYGDVTDKLDNSVIKEALRSAQEYNLTLPGNEFRFQMTQEERDWYNQQLNLAGTGMMGVIEIPVINAQLPIYHGTTEGVLKVAIGHLEGSSLPVGGPSTHCVLTGHRGLPSARLFTDLPKLQEGDTFNLTVLNEVLTYQVDQILTVTPYELDALEIIEGEDHCTLITCTPYGINTHRLMVRGTRVGTILKKGPVRVRADALRIDPLFVAITIGVPLVLLFVISVVLIPPKKEE